MVLWCSYIDFKGSTMALSDELCRFFNIASLAVFFFVSILLTIFNIASISYLGLDRNSSKDIFNLEDIFLYRYVSSQLLYNEFS